MKTNFDVITESPEKLAREINLVQIRASQGRLEFYDDLIEWLNSEAKEG